MRTILYILNIIYRIRLWLIGIPLIVTLIALFFTRNLPKSYQVTATVYAGVASGYNIESGTGGAAIADWNSVNNAMDNIINIIYSQATLKKVSIRLYARNMIHGNPEKDNNYITAAHFRELMSITPDEVKALIDKSSEENTVAQLQAYEQPNNQNFVYGLFNYIHPHYSYQSLSTIDAKRMGTSDMIDIKYTSDDPGIAYNTMLLLLEEFVNNYRELRFAETDNVIKYFEEELAKAGRDLRFSEDSLTNYNRRMKVINYDEQTKHVAALTRDFELNYETILLAYESSMALLQVLDERIDESVRAMVSNSKMNTILNDIGNLTTRITQLEAFTSDSLGGNRNRDLQFLYGQRDKLESEYRDFFVEYGVHKYSKEGVANKDIVDQWLAEKLNNAKATAEMDVMRQRKIELDRQYEYYSPIGSTIKRQERTINLTENRYLELLHALNMALMRKKNLEMSSASLKVISEPIFPIRAVPTARKLIVMAAFLGSILFVLGFFLILELLDRTLRDKERAERLTKLSVIGAFLGAGKLKYRGYNKECYRIASTYLANAMISFLDQGKQRNVVNLISTEDSDGKQFVASKLEEQWSSLGLKVKVLSWHDDLMADPRRYVQAHSIFELFEAGDEDIIIVEQPPLRVSNIPASLLQESDVNLLTARADRVWKDTDQLLLERVKSQMGDVPLYMYLTQAERETVEHFTGMLPPFTPTRKLIYRIFQLGLTSKR